MARTTADGNSSLKQLRLGLLLNLFGIAAIVGWFAVYAGANPEGSSRSAPMSAVELDRWIDVLRWWGIATGLLNLSAAWFLTSMNRWRGSSVLYLLMAIAMLLVAPLLPFEEHELSDFGAFMAPSIILFFAQFFVISRTLSALTNERAKTYGSILLSLRRVVVPAGAAAMAGGFISRVVESRGVTIMAFGLAGLATLALVLAAALAPILGLLMLRDLRSQEGVWDTDQAMLARADTERLGFKQMFSQFRTAFLNRRPPSQRRD